MLQLVSHHEIEISRHEIENQDIVFKTFGTELRRVVGLHQILAGSVIGTTTKLSMSFQVLVLWLHLKYSS